MAQPRAVIAAEEGTGDHIPFPCRLLKPFTLSLLQRDRHLGISRRSDFQLREITTVGLQSVVSQTFHAAAGLASEFF